MQIPILEVYAVVVRFLLGDFKGRCTLPWLLAHITLTWSTASQGELYDLVWAEDQFLAVSRRSALSAGVSEGIDIRELRVGETDLSGLFQHWDRPKLSFGVGADYRYTRYEYDGIEGLSGHYWRNWPIRECDWSDYFKDHRSAHRDAIFSYQYRRRRNIQR